MLNMPRQFRQNRVRLISGISIVVLCILVGASVIIPLSANNYFTTIADKWRVQNAISEHEGQLISDIYRHLGYGGFIHKFKNYVIRRETSQREGIAESIELASLALDELEDILRSDTQGDLSHGAAAISEIRKTLDSYMHNLEIVDEATRLGWSSDVTDSLVRVDDTPAILGLLTLRESWRVREQTAKREFESLVREASSRLKSILWFVPFLVLAGLTIIWFVRRLTSEINSRQMAQDELRRAELLVESIAQLGNGISIFDHDLKLVASNENFIKLLELPPALAVPGISLAELFRFNAARGEYGPGDVDQQVEERTALAFKFEPHTFERIRPDGTVVEVNGIPLPGNAGMVTTYTDVSARKAAETALAEKERQLRASLDTMSDGIFVIDKNLNLVLYNQRYIDFIDQPPHMIGTGKPIEPLIRLAAERGDYGPGSIDEIVADRLEVLSQPISATSEVQVHRGVRQLELRKEPMPGGGAVVVVSDVTERRKARAEIELKESQLTTTLESMSAGILLIGKDNKIQLFNEAAAKLYAFPKDVLRKGAPLMAIARIRAERGDYGNGNPDELTAERMQSYEMRECGRYIDQVPGGRFLDVFRAPTPDGNTVVVFHDITESRRTEERLRENEEQLTQNILDLVETQKDLTVQSKNLVEMAEKYAEEKEKAQASERSKSEFLASMSHEIRTPMTGVLGLADILLDAEMPVDQREMVLKIKSAGQSLLTIINDILDLSKLEAGKLDVEHINFNLIDVIEDAIGLVRPKADDQGLFLKTSYAKDFPSSIEGDPTRVRQILINLVGNAVKFTHEGGITVHASHSERNDGQLLIRVAVEDTGIGISDNARDNLFQDFTQADASTSRRYEGTGLGLSISKRLTELMGGEIGVESDLGRGSTFWFTLVAEKAADDIYRPLERTGDYTIIAKRKLVILIAEDNELNQLILKSVLAPLGHDITFVASGTEAVNTMKARGADFDVILMDVRMPEMSGPDATRAIRQMPEGFSKIPIVAVTADITEDHVAGYFEAGMNGFATKPIDRAALFQAINEVLGDEVHVTEWVGENRDSLPVPLEGADIEPEDDTPLNDAVAGFLDSIETMTKD